MVLQRDDDRAIENVLKEDQEDPSEVAEVLEAHQKLESLFGHLRSSEEPTDQRPQTIPDRIGRYEIRDWLGSGTFGNVYLGFDSELERQVAIKIPRVDQLVVTKPEQFLREARAAAQLNHPNIVSVHEVGQEQDLVYIVSDFIEGESLDYWHKGQPLGPREAAQLCIMIADAIEHAHQAGIVHRDLKPSNIMMDRDDNPHVMDFGLAKRESGDASLTIEGRIVGTPAYMSPEQARGDSQRVDGRSDVYALGVILFELLTGERPFRGSSQMLIHQLLHEDAPSLRKLNSHVPRDLETICLKCLEKEPGKRFVSAKQFSQDLQNWIESKPISARPVGSLGRAVRWCQRRPAVAGLSAAVLLSLFAGTGISTYYAIDAANEAAKASALEQVAKQKTAEAEREAKNARKAQRDADEEREEAVRQANIAQAAELVAREKTEEVNIALREAEESAQKEEASFQESLDLVNFFFVSVSNDDLIDRPGMQKLRQELLNRADVFYQEQLGRPEKQDNVQLRIQATRIPIYLAEIEILLGNLDSARKQCADLRVELEKLSAKNVDKPELMSRLARCHELFSRIQVEEENLEDAALSLVTAIQFWERVLFKDSTNVDYMMSLLQAYSSLGEVGVKKGDLPLAGEAFAEAIALKTRLVEAPAIPPLSNFVFAQLLHNKGIFDIQKGYFTDGLENLEQSMVLLENSPKSNHYRAKLARVRLDYLRYYDPKTIDEKRIQVASQTLADCIALADENPAVPSYQRSLFEAYRFAAKLEYLRFNGELARDYGDLAAKILLGLITVDPQSTELRFQKLFLYLELSDHQGAIGNKAASRAFLNEAFGAIKPEELPGKRNIRELMQGLPHIIQNRIIHEWVWLFGASFNGAEFAEGKKTLTNMLLPGIKSQRRIAPDNDLLRFDQATLEVRHAAILVREPTNSAQGMRLLKQVLIDLESLYSIDKACVRYLRELFNTHGELVNAYYKKQDLEKHKYHLSRMAELSREWNNKFPGIEAQLNEAHALLGLAGARLIELQKNTAFNFRGGFRPAAIPGFREVQAITKRALDLREKAASDYQQQGRNRTIEHLIQASERISVTQANLLFELSQLIAAARQRIPTKAEASELLDIGQESIALFERFLALNPNDEVIARYLIQTYHLLAPTKHFQNPKDPQVQHYLQTAFTLAQAMWERYPLNAENVELLAQSHLALATWYATIGDKQADLNESAKAFALYENAIVYKPTQRLLEVKYCIAQLTTVVRYVGQENYEPAIRFLENGLKRLVRLGPGPDLPQAQYTQLLFHSLDRGYIAYRSTKEYERYIALCKGHLSKVPPQLRPMVTVLQSRMVATTGNHGEAAKLVRSAVTPALAFRLSGPEFHYAAVTLEECSSHVLADDSLPSSERESLSKKYLEEAVEFIKKADWKGIYRHAAFFQDLRTNPALKKVREHPEIKAILEKLPPVPMPPKK